MWYYVVAQTDRQAFESISNYLDLQKLLKREKKKKDEKKKKNCTPPEGCCLQENETAAF